MTPMPDPATLTLDEQGLIPAIVQDAATGDVLMVAWMNTESIEATHQTGLVHFWSRSRRALWKKGESSGNVLAVETVAPDCDRDVLLVTVRPSGPACHTGATSCFDGDDTVRPGFGQLGALWRTIERRAAERPSHSYTTTLLEGGVDATGRKVVEEATEVLMAAKDHAAGAPIDPVISESADLLYHLLVLWSERGVDPARIMDELNNRAS